MRRSAIRVLVCGLVAATCLRADELLPPTNNAALRYWSAFAELENPPADPATAKRLAAVASGSAAWDEALLGPILDRNATALATLRRAASLPECSWGLDYELGPDTPIVYVARGRVLARLNVLDARRRQARHDAVGAVDALLAGVPLASRLANGGTLLSGLVGAASLSAHLRALEELVAHETLDDAALARIEALLRALPPEGIDWAGVYERETAALGRWLETLSARAPAEAYRALDSAEIDVKIFGLDSRPLDPGRIRAALVAFAREYREVGVQVGKAYRLPYLAAQQPLEQIGARLGPGMVQLLPKPARANRVRAETEANRALLLAQVMLVRGRLKTGRLAASLEGLDAPADPFTGRPLALVPGPAGVELQSGGGTDAEGWPLACLVPR